MTGMTLEAAAATISVVCPVHNTPPELVLQAARSVLAEPADRVIELLLVDDASRSADTRAALEALRAEDPRVRLIRLERNGGPGPARNAGLRAATGTWVGFVDSDDFWLPGRAALLDEVLARHPEANWISGNYRVLMPDGEQRDLTPLSAETALCHPLGGDFHQAGGPALTKRILADFCIHLGPTLIRRSICIPDRMFLDRFITATDVLFLLRLSTAASLIYVDRLLYAQRMEIGSITTSDVMLRHGDASMLRVAWRDPVLRPFRRELRWARYSAEKRLAISNLLRGQRLRGVGFALRALLLDPREIGEFLYFLSVAAFSPEALRHERLRRYSGSKPIDILAPTGSASAR